MTINYSVSAMSHSFTVPVSAKLRLCQPAPKTLDLAIRLEACGASWITLHARTVSSRRRRHGAADLMEVQRLKNNLRVPVVSNGNVRVWSDLEENRRLVGADGLMVGETLLGNPWYAKASSLRFIHLFYLRLCFLTLALVFSSFVWQSLRQHCPISYGDLSRIPELMSNPSQHCYSQDCSNSYSAHCRVSVVSLVCYRPMSC